MASLCELVLYKRNIAEAQGIESKTLFQCLEGLLLAINIQHIVQ